MRQPVGENGHWYDPDGHFQSLKLTSKTRLRVAWVAARSMIMIVFWNERISILSVPKTASSALEAALGMQADMVVRHPPELKHAPVYRYDRWLRPYFEKAGRTELETLAVIRHPMDWLKSWYRYRQRAEIAGRPSSTIDVSFDEFLAGYLLDPKKRPEYARVGSQGRFLEASDGSLGVDYLFRYEQQEALIAFLQSRLAREIDMPVLNASPHAEISVDPMLAEQHQVDFAQDYTFWALAASERLGT